MADPAWWPAITVEVAFGTDPGSNPGAWTDITDYVYGFGTQRGRANELQAFQAGTCTIRLDNKDGRFDPTNTSGAYYPDVLPMRHIRVSAVWSATTYRIFRGFVESWPMSWPSSWEDEVEITCVDAFKQLQLAAFTESRPSELTSFRTAVILFRINPGLPVTIDTGLSTAVAIDYDRSSSLSAIQQLEETENGEFWIAKDGTPTFHNRTWRALNKTTPSVTFGDVSFSDIDYEDPVVSYDDSYLYNDVKVTDSATPTPNTATSSDTTSQTKYLTRSLERTLLISSATEAQDCADFLVGLYKDPRLRIEQVKVNPAPTSTAAWPALLGLELGDRVTFKRTTPAGNAINQDFHVEQIQHSVSRGTSDGAWWIATLGLSPAVNQSLWILDSTTNSVLDSTTRLSY